MLPFVWYGAQKKGNRYIDDNGSEKKSQTNLRKWLEELIDYLRTKIKWIKSSLDLGILRIFEIEKTKFPSST